jgi:hypothetical protein
MPYEIYPEQEFLDLSETDVYEHVSQLAANEQLAEELRPIKEDSDLALEDDVIEMYCINPEVEVPVSRFNQARRELEVAKEKQYDLRCRRRLPRY